MSNPADMRALFHQLNNQLGVVLSQAELLQSKAPDPATRDRASQVVTAALEAIDVSRRIRLTLEPDRKTD